MSAGDLPITTSWFPTAEPHGPAYGDPVRTTWANFARVLSSCRREGEKDGPNFVAARFKLEPDGKHVRRLARNLIARTAVVMDCEYNKKTGEFPPTFAAAVGSVRNNGWASIVYTSHNHFPRASRYRIVLPLSEELDYELPAVEVVADRLQLSGVLDRSKVGASSLFYLPSCPPGLLDDHDVAVIDGDPIDAAWISEVAGKLLAERKAEHERIAAEAHAHAEARCQAKIAAGFDPDDLIEKIRSRLDLEQILLSHNYDKRGAKYRHPNSKSGSFGADIKSFGGIERVFSWNAGDPLHHGNFPSWCGGVKAIDAVDVTIILDYGGDRTKALHDLAKRFGLAKTQERKQLANLLFQLFRHRAAQEEIEARTLAEGARLGLTQAEVCDVARYAVAKAVQEATERRAA